jgi:cell division protein FtsI (penicillin-binding protein 3)
MSFLSRIMVLKSRGHFSTGARGASPRKAGANFEGIRKRKAQQARNRVGLVIFGFTALYCVIGGRMVYYAMSEPQTTSSIPPADRLMASRPDIVDRNGALLATDIRTVSLFAEPHKIVDADEVIEKLSTVLHDLDIKGTYAKLSSKSRFQWLKRQLTPKQQSQILALGIPGIGFRPEKRRFYPGGPTAAHIVGYVNIDNRGVSGMERYIDSQGLADLASVGMTSNQPLEPVKLSIDVRVQAIVRDVVAASIDKYKSIGGGAVVLDVHTGEILGMASAPDFDPNDPNANGPEGWMNRMTNSTFEMGSTFKSFTIAMGLDEKKITLNDSIDARFPIRMGGYTVKDFHGKGRFLSVAEVFQYSSNIGTAKIADAVGIPDHKAFLTKLGLLTRMKTELPEIATPSAPREWKKINQVTISFGHGVSTTPLQTAVAGAALVNGGVLHPPTFLPRTEEQAAETATQVMNASSSKDMRYLFEWNGSKGSGRNARVDGFDVGGKTGTADKVVNGRYAHDKNFNAFLAAFPMSNPRYVVLSFSDEPKTDKGNGAALAATSAAPMVKEIIARAAPILGVQPSFGENGSALLVSY